VVSANSLDRSLMIGGHDETFLRNDPNTTTRLNFNDWECCQDLKDSQKMSECTPCSINEKIEA
jgi:hypothetical protein